VFVCAERPDRVLTHLADQGLTPARDPASPWLLRFRVGFLDIAIIICRLLPLEEPYYQWLLFAPSGSLKWREFVKMLIRKGDRTLLRLIQQLKPKEFNLITLNIAEILKEFSPEERARYEQDRLELLQNELRVLGELNPQKMGEMLAGLTPEQRLAGLEPETLTARLTSEQRLAGLEPEQRLAGLEPEQRLAGLEPEQRLAGLEPEQRQKLLELLSQPARARENEES